MSPLQEIARAAVIFAYGLLALRLAGRRTFAKWSALDTVVAIMVGSNLSRALTGNSELVGTLAASSVLLLLHWILARLAAQSSLVSSVLEGSAVPLALAGELIPLASKRHAISRADLNEALRVAGIEKLDETSVVMLEPSGKITVLKRPTARSVNPA